jgi:bifunctional DNase/RNase
VLALERIFVAVVRVVITHVSSGTYYADIVLRHETDDEVTVSARPSDAIAIALRASCPIYAQDDLLDLVGEAIEEEEAVNTTEILDEFRDFIENISPEDFGA